MTFIALPYFVCTEIVLALTHSPFLSPHDFCYKPTHLARTGRFESKNIAGGEVAKRTLLILHYFFLVEAVGKMSPADEKDDKIKVQRCASCGIAGVDEIKLKDCDDCDHVRYCSDECQRDHRPQHEEECKKRAAELQDEILFKQPEGNHWGDCPICCLPMPIDPRKTILVSCCSKNICDGCNIANQNREREGRMKPKCPFCRKDLPDTDEEWDEQLMKRIEANDPVAICQMGRERYDEGDYTAAFDYWTRAVALGDIEAHYRLSMMYNEGEGVEKDEKKELHHLTEAAMEGHPEARHNLGCFEWKDGRMDRAVKHYIIAAKLGDDDSLECVKNMYKDGHVSKDDFAAALRGHQAAIDASKSPQREEAYEFIAKMDDYYKQISS